jgi:DHA3 family macrolide efflux protein-like MFS transporter
LGQAVSLITSSVLQMALVWHLTNTTGSAMILSIATMVGFLPQAILGTMIGVFVDRWNRKLVMIGADIMIAAAGMILALLSLNMQLPVWAVMAVLFIRSIGTAFILQH